MSTGEAAAKPVKAAVRRREDEGTCIVVVVVVLLKTVLMEIKRGCEGMYTRRNTYRAKRTDCP